MKYMELIRPASSRSGIARWSILCYILLATACTTTPREREIVIISTNDIHGNIIRFPKLATFVKRTKAAHPNVILVDAGDRFTGNPYVDYADDRGKPVITLMNELGYSVATLGNHECDYGQKILRQRINDATFPIVCANINSYRSELDSISPHCTLTVDGIKLCFIGLLHTNNGLPDANPDNYSGITFDDYRETAPRYKHLKQTCDAFIALTHLGVQADSVLALTLPELDIIIGGHTHTLLDTPLIVNNVMIGQAKALLAYVGITTLKFSGKKLIHRSYRSVNIDTIAHPAPETLARVQQFCNNPKFQQIIGHAAHPLSHQDIARTVTTAMLDTTRSDFAFYNIWGIRVHQIPRGNITLGKLLEIEPFDNHIVMHEMTGQEIKLLILNRSRQTNENPFIDLYLAGGNFTILRDSTGKSINVDILDASGNPVSDEKRYKVALNNYINARYPFPGKGGGVHTEISIIDAVLAYLKKHPSL